ncbi:MAG: c-type cytochrome, partial [Ignavibacteriae bacterium]|nr:c-type cytochrome [Ignavibacteriota bacterium]
MNKFRIYFAVSSVVFLLVLVISPFKDFFREWKWYQYAYNNLVKDLPQKTQPADIGIKQIWIRKMDKVDRCVTCHLGLKEKALIDAKQPFRTHPHIYHDFEDYGCTICHEGQGPATTYKESVGKVKYWDRPIFPKKYMEAACAKCHKESKVKQAPILTLGRKLIEESNCVGCHKIEGYRGNWVPSLDGIGSKVNRTWLFNWLKNPKTYFSTTKMPNFQLSNDEIILLTDFLMAQKSFPNNISLEPLPLQLTTATDEQKTTLEEIGSTRFREARCISCHRINGKGGSVATDLGMVASKVSKQWLYNYIKFPKHLQPNVEMPRYRFSENELIGMVSYMESEFVDFEFTEIPASIPDPAYYEKGLALFKKYNCGGCHELNGMNKSEELGPELSFVGSKKLYEIDFGLRPLYETVGHRGKSSIEQSLPSYLFNKLKSPRVFSTNMKMPDYEFTDEEAQAITVALLGSVNDAIPEDLIVKSERTGTYEPQGEFGKLVNDLACFGCHTMFGRGRLVAT